MEALNFLIWPFLACLLLILIHAYFGIHILERGIIFVDLALAQFIGIGIALSFVFGEEKSQLFSISAAILILDRSPHGMEEFKTILNGNIIWVTPREILSTFIVYGSVGALHFFLRRQFHALTFEGKGNFLLEFLFFASFAVVLVKSVHIAGILQVFSFLVIPALIGRLFFRQQSTILMVGWLVGVLVSVLGIFLSYRLDLPTAPLIVAGLALIFFVLLACKVVFQKRHA